MRYVRAGVGIVLTAAATLGVQALPAAAQTNRVSIVPIVGVTWQGHRYETNFGGAAEVTLGPTRGAELGAAVEFRPWGRVAVTGSATFSPLDYVQIDPDGTRNIFGDQSIIRFTAGLKYHVVPNAPGYFAAGVLFNAIRPGEPNFEEDRVEPGGYGGIGLNVGGGRTHLRVEGRIMVMSPGADTVIRPGGFNLTFEPRSTVVDWSFGLGFVLGL